MKETLHTLALDLMLACGLSVLALISFGAGLAPVDGGFLAEAAHLATMMGLMLAGTYGLCTMWMRDERLLLFPARAASLVAGAFLGLTAPFAAVALLA